MRYTWWAGIFITIVIVVTYICGLFHAFIVWSWIMGIFIIAWVITTVSLIMRGWVYK